MINRITAGLTGIVTGILLAGVPAYSAEMYTIESLSPDGVVTVSLKMPVKQSEYRLKARGTDWGLETQISHPRCGETVLTENSAGEWTVPADCLVVMWETVPVTVSAGEINASAQQTIRLPDNKYQHNALLFSEPASLLRIAGEIQEGQLIAADGIIVSGAKSAAEHALVVPAQHLAPEFYLIGDLDIQKEVTGNVTVMYAGDNPELIRQYRLNESHRKALLFLTGIFPLSPPEDNTLLVIWLGNDEKNRVIGGAAGHRSFLANYLYGSASGKDLNNAKTLMVAAHEQFHQLADMHRNGVSPQAVWAEEGIAQYYGLKALAQTDINQAIIAEITAHFIQPESPVKQTFTELDSRFRQGDRSVYPLFYTQGATFWSELDNLLTTASGGKSGLDSLVMLLITSEPDKNGGLPPVFRHELIRIGGEPVRALLEKYTGN